MKNLPKTLYVKVEPDDDSVGYFVADANAYGLAQPGEKIKIGTYQLVEVNTAEMILDVRKAK